MTNPQRTRIREILTTIQQSGIAFAFQPHRQVPEYGADWGLAEIEKVMAQGEDSLDDIGLLLAEVGR